MLASGEFIFDGICVFIMGGGENGGEKAAEERMGTKRVGLEFRVKLGGDEEWMDGLGQF